MSPRGGSHIWPWLLRGGGGQNRGASSIWAWLGRVGESRVGRGPPVLSVPMHHGIGTAPPPPTNPLIFNYKDFKIRSHKLTSTSTDSDSPLGACSSSSWLPPLLSSGKPFMSLSSRSGQPVLSRCGNPFRSPFFGFSEPLSTLPEDKRLSSLADSFSGFFSYLAFLDAAEPLSVLSLCFDLLEDLEELWFLWDESLCLWEAWCEVGLWLAGDLPGLPFGVCCEKIFGGDRSSNGDSRSLSESLMSPPTLFINELSPWDVTVGPATLVVAALSLRGLSSLNGSKSESSPVLNSSSNGGKLIPGGGDCFFVLLSEVLDVELCFSNLIGFLLSSFFALLLGESLRWRSLSFECFFSFSCLLSCLWCFDLCSELDSFSLLISFISLSDLSFFEDLCLWLECFELESEDASLLSFSFLTLWLLSLSLSLSLLLLSGGDLSVLSSLFFFLLDCSSEDGGLSTLRLLEYLSFSLPCLCLSLSYLSLSLLFELEDECLSLPVGGVAGLGVLRLELLPLFPPVTLDDEDDRSFSFLSYCIQKKHQTC